MVPTDKYTILKLGDDIIKLNIIHSVLMVLLVYIVSYHLYPLNYDNSKKIDKINEEILTIRRDCIAYLCPIKNAIQQNTVKEKIISEQISSEKIQDPIKTESEITDKYGPKMYGRLPH